MTLEQALEYTLLEHEGPNAPGIRTSESPPVAEPPLSLTRREREIAALVARGLTNRQIASEMVISEHTVATHVGRILKKLGLQSRAQIGSWLTERPTTDPN